MTESYSIESEVLKALAHPLRLRIIAVLEQKELCFSELHKELGGLKSSLSQHLSQLVNQGLLASRKDSRCVYFSLACPEVSRFIGLAQHIAREGFAKKQAQFVGL